VFEKMLTYANHLGPYSDEIRPTGEQHGNSHRRSPHLALIDAALTLDKALDDRWLGPGDRDGGGTVSSGAEIGRDRQQVLDRLDGDGSPHS
jgi:hypothetical protein